jgi:hypothetical protein
MSFYTSNCTATSNGVDMTGASLIVVVENNYINDPTLNTVTDSGGNTWHHLTPQRDINWAGSSVVIWYAYDKAGAPLVTGSNQTVTIAGGFNQSFVVSAWRGSLTGADPFDSENGFKPSSFADSTTTVQAGSITPSQSNELIIAGVGALQSTDGIMTINSGFTSLGSVPAVTSMFVQTAYLLQGGPAAVNLTWTGSTNYFHSAVIAAFKAGS